MTRTPRRPIARPRPRCARALDRRLWADATERLLDLQTTQDVQSAIDRGRTSRDHAPREDGPAGRLIEKAVGPARQNLGALRQSEVKELAGVLRES